ncbi:MAG TPA: cysteine hydrolase [Terriglobales bacterium]|nr:cysteine hydrolase [Terriglobales bacterium]
MNAGVSFRNLALIVWDMQNGIARRALNFDEIVRNTKRLIEAAHKSEALIVYSQHTGMPSQFLSRYSRYSLKRRGIDPDKSTFVAEGSEEWKIVNELTPGKDDLILKKYFASFFVGTPLEQILRTRGVETLILCGVSTEGGIDGTARHGGYLGFIPVISQDAVGSFDRQSHEAMLEIMRKMFEVASTDAIVKKMETQ